MIFLKIFLDVETGKWLECRFRPIKSGVDQHFGLEKKLIKSSERSLRAIDTRMGDVV